ncbi:hypothetical protein [Providencia sp.]|uniref:hypothetical protein n=1 Tax=Providencia sp. TaxID=589 RepID=UPI000E956D18|nr:hypothetical protein [Providencia sp.]HBO24322.1 hypothetical protein [Providencia sp.]
MKLINSKLEQEIRENLAKRSPLIMGDKEITNFLIQNFQEIKSVYVLQVTPDQGEELYTLLVNGDKVIDFEISRINNSIYDVHIRTVDEYSKEIKKKLPKLKLIIALELSKQAYNAE